MILPSIYSLSSVEGNPINDWLTQPVLEPDEFLGEVREFLKMRIPKLEVPDTGDKWLKESHELRERILDRVIFRGVPEEWYEDNPLVVWGDVIETGNGYVIRKLRYESLPGLWIPALLYEPAESEDNIPAILNVNGHVGPPGKTIDYEQIRCINLAKRGMLALHPEWLFFGELQGDDYKHNRQAYLDLCGTSGVSVFFLAMQRGIDVLRMYPKTDPERIAMTGLSGGGWQTIMLSSLDTRISAVVPNAGYICLNCRSWFREDIGDLEQNPNDLLTIADYTHLTAMLAPRPALLIYNEKDDCCFQSHRARTSVYEPIIPFYELFDRADKFLYHENKDPGTHNYDKDNRQQFYKFINRCFLPESDWIDEEIPSDDEVLEYDRLVVGLPDNNANFFTLGSELIKDLPVNLPVEKDRLKQVLRLEAMTAKTVLIEECSDDGLKAKLYKLSIDDIWSIPAVSISTAEDGPESVVIIFSDKGKSSIVAEVEELVKNGSVVIAIDPLFMGECISPKCPVWQQAQMISTVGERALGIQTGQIGAIVEWACQELGVDKVSLYGIGWNASIASLCVGGVYGDKLDKISVKDFPESLKELIRNHMDYETIPALFCFGLLEQFDVQELVKLCSSLELDMKGSSE
jgi:dienelactone hydrolase